MDRYDKLKGAADDAAEKAKQKITKLNAIQFQQFISDLEKECVDADTISTLKSTIHDTTKRNKLITDLVEKGGNVANCIINILNKVK
ncbi:MAG: hypothetical protein LBP67_07840 [Bacteroidales bacterium]|jgi:thiamine biosynthesis protein ThiC|nr:hypothetical protein [Bacteroidales bacterium]